MLSCIGVDQEAVSEQEVEPDYKTSKPLLATRVLNGDPLLKVPHLLTTLSLAGDQAFSYRSLWRDDFSQPNHSTCQGGSEMPGLPVQGHWKTRIEPTT